MEMAVRTAKRELHMIVSWAILGSSKSMSEWYDQIDGYQVPNCSIRIRDPNSEKGNANYIIYERTSPDMAWRK